MSLTPLKRILLFRAENLIRNFSFIQRAWPIVICPHFFVVDTLTKLFISKIKLVCFKSGKISRVAPQFGCDGSS